MSGTEPHIIIVDDNLAMSSTAKVLLEFRVVPTDQPRADVDDEPSEAAEAENNEK